MLTWSNWHSELRSNRYHYATRFARNFPVLFVQADLGSNEYKFEQTEIPNLTILHISKSYDRDQKNKLNAALLEHRCLRPLFWTYNVFFEPYLKERFDSFIVYHATEDYLMADWRAKFPKYGLAYNRLMDLLKITDLLIPVSEGVEEGFDKVAMYQGEKLLVTNGCDYKFFAPDINTLKPDPQGQKSVFYEGNIFAEKLNYALIQQLAQNMPDWEFWFCGKVLFSEDSWLKLLKQSNVKYLGVLSADELRNKAYQATIGIIPFHESDHLLNRSLPLKAFEYIACGLPVVTVPIRSLLGYSHVFNFASSAQEFENEIRLAEKTRYDKSAIAARLEVARKQDYDVKYLSVTHKIESLMPEFNQSSEELTRSIEILVLYDPKVILHSEKQDLMMLSQHSRHKIHYQPVSKKLWNKLDFSFFETIIVHYSLDIFSISNNPKFSIFSEALKGYSGYKLLLVRDRRWKIKDINKGIKLFGIHTVFTTLPEKYINKVYPIEQFPFVEFKSTWEYLTNVLDEEVPANSDSETYDILNYVGENIDAVYRIGKCNHESFFLMLDKFIAGKIIKPSNQKFNTACVMENYPLEIFNKLNFPSRHIYLLDQSPHPLYTFMINTLRKTGLFVLLDRVPQIALVLKFMIATLWWIQDRIKDYTKICIYIMISRSKRMACKIKGSLR